MDRLIEAEALALTQLFDASLPVQEWLLAAVKRAESRRQCSDLDIHRQERNLWVLASKLAARGLLGGSASQDAGAEVRHGVARFEASRRWQCTLSWLEAIAKEDVEYFNHSSVDSQAKDIEGDCVEGTVAKTLSLTRGACFAAASPGVLPLSNGQVVLS